MKKLMYLLPFAALAMASCSSSEDVAQNVQTPSQELKFFTAVQGNTRGAIETTASLSNFNVILNGKFSTTADATGAASLNVATYSTTATKNGSSWNLAQNYFWGDETTVGKFTAYANADVTAASGMLADVTVAADVDDQKDLLVAYNEGNKTAFAAGVPLNFRHAMSQIVVKASYADESDVETYPLASYPTRIVKVKGIKFFNLKNKGTLTLPTASTASGQDYTPAWSAHSGSAAFEVNYDTPITLGSTATAIDLSEDANPLLLLPQTTPATDNLAPASPATVTGAYMAVLVDINTAAVGETPESDYYPKAGASEEYAWVAVPVSIEWNGGSKYTYTLNFSNIALGAVAPDTDSALIPDGKTVGDKLPSALLTKVNFLVTVEDEWTEYNATPAF